MKSKPLDFVGAGAVPQSSPGFLSLALRFAITGAVSMSTIWLSLGRMAAEKIATAVVMPTGLLWLLLLFSAAYAAAARQRVAAVLLLFCWMALSAMGNGVLCGQLARSLEGPYLQLNPLQSEPVDVLLVLGGGGGLGPNGRLQGNGSGDRLILAAQLYHSGIARSLICTGQRIESMNSTGVDPADCSASILIGLGVPEQAIRKVGGRNTSEEMSTLAQEFGSQQQRVGLLTSAWHLPRALRLAERHGLTLEPFPADFRSGPQSSPPTPGELIESMIPSGPTIATCTALLKEYLGMLAGR